MTHLDDWLNKLAYVDFPEELFRAGESAGTRPYAAEIDEMLVSKSGIGASAVFCVSELPTVCIVDGTTLAEPRDQRIEQFRQRVWNQNLASVVLVLDPSHVAAYSVFDRKAEAEIVTHTRVNRRGLWSAYEVQSGFVKDRLSGWFSPDQRVDRRLLANLREIVQHLKKEGLSPTQAEALMAQVIFLCYLEQRGIIGPAYRRTHNLRELDEYVAYFDGKGVDRLLRQLGADFNGDFLSSTDGGAPRWLSLSQNSFLLIQKFLEAVDFETGQGSLWRYDFSHIPVELISGIYETLLKDRQGALGAYYTPRHLAQLVVEQAFEGSADPASATIYDGASGSGILLTTAFRKMLRHAEVSKGRRLRLRERIELMRNNIFGNDLDETACWITAFSLYLSLLEGLDPADISLLQTDEELKLPPLVGKDLNIQRGSERGDFFSDKNPYSSSRRFDIFICNPPWRESEGEEAPLWEEWCRKQVPPYPIGRRQIASGFAYRATRSVHDNGVIALIMPLNLMVGATRQSCEFRQRWLEDVRIDRIINFGDMRRLLFPAAKHPCAVVRATPRSREGDIVIPLGESIDYWTPKADVSLAFGSLTVHAIDQKRLPSREVYDKPYMLITHYWGERRDAGLLQKLQKFGTLRRTMASRPDPWVSGKGFHAPNRSNPDRTLGLLGKLSFLPTDYLLTECPVIASDVRLRKVKDFFGIVASPGGRNGRLYSGPRVLFPDGLGERFGVRAVYSEVPFAFQSSIGAIGGTMADADIIKFLAAYLRSPLASYLLMMRGYSVIAERPRIAIDDIEEFPFCDPDAHPCPREARVLVKAASALIDKISETPEWLRESGYLVVKNKLDELVYEYFCLSATEKILVGEAVNFIATSIQPSDYSSLSTPLLRRPEQSEIESYIQVLARELTRWRELRKGRGAIIVKAITEGSGGFFGAVRVAASDGRRDAADVVNSSREFSLLLSEVTDSMRAQLSSIDRADLFKIPNIMVLAGDVFYFIKPMRRRFWLSRAALADADYIIRMVQSVAWKSV